MMGSRVSESICSSPIRVIFHLLQRRQAWRLLIALVVLMGCAPQSAGSPSAAREQNPAQTSLSVQAKPLLIGMSDEPAALAGKFGGGRSGLAQYAELFGAQLVRYDYQHRPVPQLAVEVPSLDSGTWRSFPDGTMET